MVSGVGPAPYCSAIEDYPPCAHERPFVQGRSSFCRCACAGTWSGAADELAIAAEEGDMADAAGVSGLPGSATAGSGSPSRCMEEGRHRRIESICIAGSRLAFSTRRHRGLSSRASSFRPARARVRSDLRGCARRWRRRRRRGPPPPSRHRLYRRRPPVMVMVMVLNSAYTGPLPRYL